MSEPRPWHRLFALAWTDFCEGSGLEVHPEVDLSVQQQFLDLLLLRAGPGPLPQPLPDGFDDIGPYNVLTFKSFQEALTGFALCELISHYSTARKHFSSSLNRLLPESDFRLYAVCVRFPRDLADTVPLTPVQEGVYDLLLGIQRIRIIVIQALRQEQNNALLQVFSTRVEQVRYAREHYRPRTTELTTLFYELLKMANEDPTMSETLKEYAREALQRLLKDVPPEQRLEGLSPEQVVKALSPEQVVKALSPEQRLQGLSPEQVVKALSPEQRLQGLSSEQRLQGLSPEQVVKALSAEELRAIMEEGQRKLKTNGSGSEPK